MTSEIVYAPMNEAEARRLTAQIASSVENTYDLLDEAMRREAWKALGYKTPAAYLRAEFPVSKSRAYQLIDQATVRRELTAIGVHNVDDLPEAHARVLAPIVRKGGPAAAAAVVDAARAKHGDSVTADDLRAASQPASHPPSDGDRSTHPAPEVPPAPSSPYSDEIIEDAPPAARILGDQFTEREDALLAQACREAGIAAEPSEPGVAGAPCWPHDFVWGSDGAEECARCGVKITYPEAVNGSFIAPPDARAPATPICTDPAHADLLSLLSDLDRLLLPRDEVQLAEWGLSDAEQDEARAMLARVRGLRGDAGTAQDAPEEAPSPDARIPAIRARLEALSAKQRAAFCRMHNVRAEALAGWVAGLNDGELDTATRELGLTGAEVP